MTIETPISPIVKTPRKKKADVAVELYAPFARWRSDLLRVETRCFGPNADSDADIEEFVKKALFLAVIRVGDTAVGYCLMEGRWPESPYMSLVAIDPDQRGKGHLARLVGTVEDELRKIGFTHFEINARIENGYADKIKRHYGERIEIAYEHGSRIGPLRFMRIRL